MSKEFSKVIDKITGLRSEIFVATATFRLYEVVMEMLAPNIVGKFDASRNAKALGNLKGFFNIAKHAANTDFLVSLAKLYDNHRDSTSIPRLLDYIRGNIDKLKLEDFINYNRNRKDIDSVIVDYIGINLSDVLELEKELLELQPHIEKLKYLRDKRIAHLDLKELDELQNVSKPKNIDQSSKFKDLTYEEITNLITKADYFLNTISSLVNKDVAEFGFLKDEVTQDSEQLIKIVRRNYDLMPTGLPTLPEVES